MDEPRADDPNHVLEFRLPDLGEGLADAELQSWSVAVGEIVELNQTIAEVETAKAVVALPSPFAGTVVELLVEPGQTVPVGAPLIRVRTSAPGSPETPPVADSSEPPAPERKSVLVGYGPDDDTVTRRRRPAAKSAQQQTESGNGAADSVANGRAAQSSGTRAATPAARKLARELGIDLWYVAGSGPEGAVTVADVRSAVPVSQPSARTAPPATAESTAAAQPAADSGAPGPSAREERTPITGIRKRTAAAMVASARTIPQAGASITVDCTATMELLDHLRTTAPFAGLTLTPLALVAKSVLAALAEFPGMNAYWDEANQEIVTKHYVNLGIAVATERGLLVPNIKDAHAVSLRDLCRDIAWLVDVTRAGNAAPTDLRGGTFTISNVGVFGVDAGMPLVNPGEAAIVCLGAINRRPWVVREELAIRWVTTLTLSFDHRMIDGEQAARFLATVGGLLEDPLTLLSRL
ncbi:dihydrolipoamide acetyltransferase family protein [Nocardia cyriacigeorgica]|uniref:dihydrolipoamide acetyltransferase family protein n=1 Tax=Nocardia cyriacigeorgica TaxID=135487 RepID=UPI0024561464|nr:dihydrolipoamide acetyltransferase family protein [Nocardia cyriacigeorgica]